MSIRHYLVYHSKITWCLYALFMNKAEQIKSDCNYEIKPHLQNIVYNIKKSVWVISYLSTEKVQVRCLQKTYHVDTKTPC